MRATRYIHYIYIIGIALCLQACHSNLETEEMAIGMAATSVESTTRALINSAADLQNIGFKVYGYKIDKAADKQQVFAGEEVTYGATNGWQYSPTRYWDRMTNYKFAAYAPATLPTYVQVTHTTGANQTLGITVPNWQAIDGTETDIIVATSQGEAADYLDLHNGTVKLDFAHILAQLEVQIVRSATLLNTYTLTGLSYKQVPEGDGNNDDNNKSDYTFNYATPSSSVMNSTATGTKTVYSGAVVVDPEAKEGTTFKHLVVPFSTQAGGGMLVAVTYKVGSGTANTITVNTGINTLEAGKRYVLTLIFNSGTNIIPKLDICAWQTEEVDEDDKYNW